MKRGERAIAEIRIGKRIRKNFGDIDELAASIEQVGLLQPIGIRQDGTLICGERRIRAFKKLGRESIPVYVCETLDDEWDYLIAENAENTCRQDLDVSEAVAIARRIEARAQAEAKRAQREGGKKGGEAKVRQTLPNLIKDDSKRAMSQAAAVAGMSRTTYEKARAVVDSGDRELIAEMDETGRVSGVHRKLVVREKAEAIASEPPPMPGGKYRVIVCDPPWHYDGRVSDASHRAANPYPSMSIDEIKALPVGDHAEADSILWLWTTNSHIMHSFDIAEAWGFTYKTMLTWAKDKMGLGDWLRGQTEHCLLCVRGKPVVQLTNQTTLLKAPSQKHSAKPDAFYELVETLCPGSKLEMFQRRPRDGWKGHGDEAK